MLLGITREHKGTCKDHVIICWQGKMWGGKGIRKNEKKVKEGTTKVESGGGRKERKKERKKRGLLGKEN
jgi:hypothetical protein